jgi:hypothetical protein
VPAWEGEYLEGHVGGVDHAEDGDAEVREDAGGEEGDGGDEEGEDEVGGAKVEAAGEAGDRREGAEGLVDVVEGGGGEGLDAVEHGCDYWLLNTIADNTAAEIWQDKNFNAYFTIRRIINCHSNIKFYICIYYKL